MVLGGAILPLSKENNMQLKSNVTRNQQFMFYKKLDIGESEPDVSFEPQSKPLVPPMAPAAPVIPMPRRKKSLDDARDEYF